MDSFLVYKGASLSSDLQTSFTSPFVECVCDINLGYQGPACNLGKCPQDANGNFCSLHGHPLYGFGYDPKSKAISLPQCSLNCASGYSQCLNNKKQCFETLPLKIQGGRPLSVDQSQCFVPMACSSTSPLKCADGSCASVPSFFDAQSQCALGYTTGTYDVHQFDQVRVQTRCEFFAASSATKNCSQVLNFTSNSITFSTTTPLVWIYMEFSQPVELPLPLKPITPTAWGTSFEQVSLHDRDFMTYEPFLSEPVYVKVSASSPTEIFVFPTPYTNLQIDAQSWSDVRLFQGSDAHASLPPQRSLQLQVELLNVTD